MSRATAPTTWASVRALATQWVGMGIPSSTAAPGEPTAGAPGTPAARTRWGVTTPTVLLTARVVLVTSTVVLAAAALSVASHHRGRAEAVRGSDLAKAFFGELTSQLGGSAPAQADPPAEAEGALREDRATYDADGASRPGATPMAELLAEVACDIERIIRRHAIVRWRENADAQNAMRNDLDDLLFGLQRTKGITLTFEQMDAILDAILRIARNRTDV